jgi:hypothetical protein
MYSTLVSSARTMTPSSSAQEQCALHPAPAAAPQVRCRQRPKLRSGYHDLVELQFSEESSVYPLLAAPRQTIAPQLNLKQCHARGCARRDDNRVYAFACEDEALVARQYEAVARGLGQRPRKLSLPALRWVPPGQRQHALAACQARQPVFAQSLVVTTQQSRIQQQRAGDERLWCQCPSALLKQQRQLRQTAAAAAMTLRQTNAGPSQCGHVVPTFAVVAGDAVASVAHAPSVFFRSKERGGGVAQHT